MSNGEFLAARKKAVPDAPLRRALEHCLSGHFGKQVRVTHVKRRISEYCSSYFIEELDVRLDHDRELQLIFKDMSQSALLIAPGRVKPHFFYDPLREIESYRKVLAAHEMGTPIFYGADVDVDAKRYWLFVERVPPVLLWQMGDFEIWKKTARWLCGMHTFLIEGLDPDEVMRSAHLLLYDADFCWCWMLRAQAFVRQGDSSRGKKSAAAIDWLTARYHKVVDRLRALRPTFIHGEFYASNVMVDHAETADVRICPIDWEMAAIGSGLFDLSALTSGNWNAEQKQAMAEAYYEALPAEQRFGKEMFLESLDYCRLHQAVQLLGWSPAWTPPPEHARDWLKEAIQLAETLKL